VLNTAGVPVVALAGPCMEAGKTAAAAARLAPTNLTVGWFEPLP
jgi:hypothetical protein